MKDRETMRTLPPAFTKDVHGTTLYHCKHHGYLNQSDFYPSSITHKNHKCKQCFRLYDKNRYNQSIEHKILESLRVRLRRMNNALLARQWEVSDIKQLINNSALSTEQGPLYVVPIDNTKECTPDNATVLFSNRVKCM